MWARGHKIYGKQKKGSDLIMREELRRQISKSRDMHHTKKGCYISTPEMLTAAAGLEDRLRSFVGLSTEVIGASVWIDLGQKKKKSQLRNQFTFGRTYRPFTTCRPA